MNQLIKQEKYYLCLLVSTTIKQKKALLQSIEKSQLRAIVLIVYNLMVGNRSLPEKDKKRLAKRKKLLFTNLLARDLHLRNARNCF